MSGQPPYPTIQGGQRLATLTYRKFEFLPDSDVLSKGLQKILDEYAVSVLKPSTLYLRIIGSAAWPGPPGRFTEDSIIDFAHRRAVAVGQYLANRIDPNRLLIDFILPPKERREILEESELEKDRFVSIELVTAGR